MTALFWFIFKGVDVVDDFTPDEKVFLKCEYNASKNIRYIFKYINFTLYFRYFFLLSVNN